MKLMCKRLFINDLKFSIIILFMVVPVFFSKQASCCLAQEQEKVLGELKLEGEHIEQLVLRGNDGHTERFNQPGEVVQLPIGRYNLLESHLDGGYVCFQEAGPQSKWITIAENRTAGLKVGAPLKQTMEVMRQGKTLILDYKLLGIGGETYFHKDRSNPPSLTVYKGDKEIASGKFTYG